MLYEKARHFDGIWDCAHEQKGELTFMQMKNVQMIQLLAALICTFSNYLTGQLMMVVLMLFQFFGKLFYANRLPGGIGF